MKNKKDMQPKPSIDDNILNIYQKVDSMLRHREYDKCSKALGRLDVNKTDISILLAWLVATLPAKTMIKKRKAFFDKIKRNCKDESEELLFGLE